MSEDRPSSRPYNFIYSQLVDDENDIVGLIAYAIYKRQKIDYIRSVHSKRQRDVDPSEMSVFHEISNSSTQVQSYRDQAVMVLNSFLNDALRQRADKMANEYQSRLTRELMSTRPQFWSGVSQSIVGSILFVLFVGLIVFFTWSMQQGPKQVIERIFNVQIISQDQADR